MGAQQEEEVKEVDRGEVCSDDVMSQEIEKGNPLLFHKALSEKNCAVLQRLKRSKILPSSILSYRDANGLSLLHHTLQIDMSSWASLLLSCNADPNITDQSGTPLFHTIIDSNDNRSNFFSLFIEHPKISLSSCDSNQRHPIHYACKRGQVEYVERLIEKGANIDIQDDYGLTPLHMACYNNQYNISNSLLNHKANVEATDAAGRSPLHFVASLSTQYKTIPILKLLLDKKISLLSLKDKKGRTALHYAVFHGNIQTVEELALKGASLEAKDEEGNTPMHIASRHVTMTKLFLNTLHTLPRNLEGQTPLHFAVLGHYSTCTKEIIKCHPSSISERDNTDRTIFHFAARAFYSSDLDSPLSGIGENQYTAYHDSLVFCADKKGKTVFHYAAGAGNLEWMKAIVSFSRYDRKSMLWSSALEKLDAAGNSPLHFAILARIQSLAICTFLFELCNRVDHLKGLLCTRNGMGQNPIHIAAACGNEACLNFLVQNIDNEYIFSSDDTGAKPIHLATASGNIKTLQLLLSATPSHLRIDDHDRSCIFYANSMKMILYLQSHGISLKEKDRYGNSLLHHAITKGRETIVKYLIEHDIISVESLDGNKRSPLHLAAECGNAKLISLLLTHHADVEVKDIYSRTPFMIAAAKGTIETLYMLEPSFFLHATPPRSLLQSTRSITCLTRQFPWHDLRDMKGRSALDTACFFGNFDAVVWLMKRYESPLDIAPANDGRNLFHAAISSGSLPLLSFLLPFFFIDSADIKGRTALHRAASLSQKSKESVRFLLAHNANPNALDMNEITPLMIASKKGNVEIIVELLQAGGEVKREDKKGRTPIDFWRLFSPSIPFPRIVKSEDENELDSWVALDSELIKVKAEAEETKKSLCHARSNTVALHRILSSKYKQEHEFMEMKRYCMKKVADQGEKMEKLEKKWHHEIDSRDQDNKRWTVLLEDKNKELVRSSDKVMQLQEIVEESDRAKQNLEMKLAKIEQEELDVAQQLRDKEEMNRYYIFKEIVVRLRFVIQGEMDQKKSKKKRKRLESPLTTTDYINCFGKLPKEKWEALIEDHLRHINDLPTKA